MSARKIFLGGALTSFPSIFLRSLGVNATDAQLYFANSPAGTNAPLAAPTREHLWKLPEYCKQ
jgi:hypothetical protein